MNFSQKDMMLIISMSIAIMALAYTMPALGLSDENASEAPEFEMDAARFDFAGTFPANPGTPARGTVEWNESEGVASENTRFITGDKTAGLQLGASTANSEPTVTLNDWNNSAIENTSEVSTSVEETKTIVYNEWEIDVRFYDIEEIDAANAEYDFKAEYTIRQRPDNGDDTGWLSNVPIVGGIVSATGELAAVVGWIGSVIWWFVTFIYQISLNLLFMLADLTVYLFSTLSWLTSTYTGLISAAESWAAVVLTIPLLVLSLELAKIVMIGISLLPTT